MKPNCFEKSLIAVSVFRKNIEIGVRSSSFRENLSEFGLATRAKNFHDVVLGAPCL